MFADFCFGIRTKNYTVPSPLITNGEIHYIGNKKSLIFHISTCKTLPQPKNRIILKSKDEAISKGFKSCGNCIGK